VFSFQWGGSRRPGAMFHQRNRDGDIAIHLAIKIGKLLRSGITVPECAVQRGGCLTPLHRREPSLSGKNFTKRISRFGRLDAGHAAEVDGAFAQKARAAIDFVAQDLMKVAQR